MRRRRAAGVCDPRTDALPPRRPLSHLRGAGGRPGRTSECPPALALGSERAGGVGEGGVGRRGEPPTVVSGGQGLVTSRPAHLAYGFGGGGAGGSSALGFHGDTGPPPG